MSIVNLQIGGGAGEPVLADDGCHSTGTRAFNAEKVIGCLGYSVNTALLVCGAFFRFADVAIPPGATINFAHLELWPDGNDTGAPELVIYGIDEADAAAPTSETEFLADPHTSASVQWDTAWTAEVWEQSPDIKNIIQEIIDLGGWVSGNALMLQVRDDLGAGPGNNVWITFLERNPDLAAKLYVEYDVGVGPSVTIMRRRRGG
jgi:hypothetical protein